ncbi:MAG: J domain-containing protein [Rickettsiales bacterium]|jgi:DnaJ-domain-containing protein 1|nr:J domain-containing protein [Rickettsiales bacterium]
MTRQLKPKKLLGDNVISSKFPLCECAGCKKPGVCRAPKNNSLREYFHFCELHAAEYNKNWNYYAGMSPEEVEKENQNDIYQRNPTWSFGIKNINQEDVRKMYFNDPHEIFSKFFGKNTDTKNNKNQMLAPTSEMGKALNTMGLSHSFTVADLKAQYKKMVKKYHPDLSKDVIQKKINEEKFKQILSAYKKLEKYLKNPSL